LPDTDPRAEHLLDDVQAIIASEGFSGLKMGALAARLHCSRTTLYKVAPSKDALILMVLERIADASFSEAIETSSVPGLSQADRITRWVEAVTRWQGYVSNVCWRDVSRWDPSARLLAAKSERAIGFLSGFIDEGIRSGEFRPVNGRFAAEIISRGSRATRDPAVLEATGLSAGEAVSQLGTLVVGGLRAR
jgi:AcrR family transcriptional regulator